MNNTPPGLPLGTIGVTPTYGCWYDRLFAWFIRWGTAMRIDEHGVIHWIDAPVNHVVIYVGNVPGHDKPQIAEARPGGAKLSDWDSYGDSMIWLTGLAPLVPSVQREIAQAALDLLGTKYGYLDLIAVGLAQRRLHSVVDIRKALAEQPWWVRRIVQMYTLICSQYADVDYLAALLHLFSDGRIPGLVSPADLYYLAHPLPGEEDG